MNRYLDSSAMVKLAVSEAESSALVAHIMSTPQPAATSIVALAEVSIAVARRGGGAQVTDTICANAPYVTLPYLSVLGLPLLDEVALQAAKVGAAHRMRALDAIHVATAMALRPELTEVITYDARMVAACTALGLPVAVPGGDLGPAI